MAATGLILVGFVTGHLVGNLQIFAHPDKINGYAHFLQSLGPALWGVRLGLLACVVLHIWAAITLVLENWTARGPEPGDRCAPALATLLGKPRILRLGVRRRPHRLCEVSRASGPALLRRPKGAPA